MTTFARRFAAVAPLALFALAGTAQAQQFLLALDSGNDRAALLNATTGDIVELNFIIDQNDPAGVDFQTPKGVAQVGDEIWITDQLADNIYRFTATNPSTYIGRIEGAVVGMDNIRGLAVVGNEVLVTNNGTANGAPGRALIRLSTAGALLGTLPLGTIDPMDVVPFENDILVSDLANDDITRLTTAGSVVSILVDGNNTTGIDFPQQLQVAPTGTGGANEIWLSSFTAPAGVYRFTNTGAQVAYFPVSTGGRGVYPLNSDQFLYTDGSGLWRFTISTGVDEQLASDSWQYITPITLAGGSACDSVDFNNDGVFPDDQDLTDFIFVLGGGTCATCNDVDFNNDGVFPDDGDLAIFLFVLGGGTC